MQIRLRCNFWNVCCHLTQKNLWKRISNNLFFRLSFYLEFTMLTSIHFSVEYPNNSGGSRFWRWRLGELGITINMDGKYIIVEQATLQTAFYGVRRGDRILKVNGRLCVGLDPNEVVGLIQRYLLTLRLSLGIWTKIWSFTLNGISPQQRVETSKGKPWKKSRMIVYSSRELFSFVLVWQILRVLPKSLLCTLRLRSVDLFELCVFRLLFCAMLIVFSIIFCYS